MAWYKTFAESCGRRGHQQVVLHRARKAVPIHRQAAIRIEDVVKRRCLPEPHKAGATLVDQ